MRYVLAGVKFIKDDENLENEGENYEEYLKAMTEKISIWISLVQKKTNRVNKILRELGDPPTRNPEAYRYTCFYFIIL